MLVQPLDNLDLDLFDLGRVLAGFQLGQEGGIKAQCAEGVSRP